MELDRISINTASPDPDRIWQLRFERDIWSALADTTDLVLVLVGDG